MVLTLPALCLQARAHFRFGTVDPLGRTIHADITDFLPNVSATGGSAWPAASYDVILSDLYDGSNPLASLSSVSVHRLKAALRPGGVLAVNIVAHFDGPHAR